VFALVLSGCGATQHEYVRPWFRIATTPRHVIAPHALEWGGVRRPEIFVGGRWRGLSHGDRKDFRVEPVGRALAVEEYTFVGPGRDPIEDRRRWGATGVFVYHRGARQPVHISAKACPTAWITPSEIACFSCGDSPLYPDQQPDSCGTLHMARYDAHGALLGRRAFPCPIAEPDVEGQLPTGEWIVAEAKLNPDFLFMYGPRVRYRLDDKGLVRLPFGADPLEREIDAELRAKDILEEVPIRDATLMSLRAALIEDERARPTWRMQTEVANRMRAGLSMEPSVPVRAGHCYALIARSTLSSLEVSVADQRATGASFATVSHCVAPGEPPHLDFRLQANAGEGYLVARIYAY